MDLTFFGLTSTNAAEYRLHLFNQIHQIVFYGNGGYDWNTVYNMPIWLRKYTFNEIKEYYQEKNSSKDNNNVIGTDGLVKDKSVFENPTISPSQPKISKPGITPKKPISYK